MTFAFYLCDGCAETWGSIANTMVMPDDVFFAKMNEAMREKYGRELTHAELQLELEDPTSVISQLSKERR